MTLELVRHGPLSGEELPNSDRVRAIAAAPATRLLLRGGAEIVAPVAGVFGVAPPTKPLGSTAEGARAALWQSPDEWLLIAEEGAAGLRRELEIALAGLFHTLVDVSHRQVGLELSGPGAARALGAYCPLDLDIEGFPVGMATRTLLAKAEIGLWRREAEHFRLEIGRSFAPYVARVLKRAARDQEAA